MSAITGTPENPSWLSSAKLLKPEARLNDATRIARAIAQLMDPEWREFVEREQQERRIVGGRESSGGGRMIICPNLGCGAILRQIDGMHSAGDAPVLTEHSRHYVVCPKCRSHIPWPVQQPKDQAHGG
jgi:hypothetical protein